VQPDRCHYPDFSVTTYGPQNENNDVIRLVIEIGSLGRELKKATEKHKAAVVKQLYTYLVVMGLKGCRWADNAVGLCIIGTEAAILKSRGTAGKFPVTVNKWVSIYSKEFKDVIELMATME
jgi:hypothetical protein